MQVLITGGCGYIGSRLVAALLTQGYSVTAYDAMIFGRSSLPRHPQLRIVEGDIRDASHLKNAMQQAQSVIHLAFLSNDPDFRLDPTVAEGVNLRGFEEVLKAALSSGVSRLVLASSCSIYGDVMESGATVDEFHPLAPLTAYATHKAECERLLFATTRRNFCTVSLRAATVCGYSPRQRLDLTFNRWAVEGYLKRRIVVHRGDSFRPHLALSDLVALYALLLRAPAATVTGRAFNAAYGNQRLVETARALAAYLGSDVEVALLTTPSADRRSYRVSSQRLEQTLNFQPSMSLIGAASELIAAVRDGLLIDPETNPAYDNRTLQQRHDWSPGSFPRGYDH